ncbi:MAG: xyloglucanase [Spirochaetales bacterium]|nr:xyloglucanase [Spirochaetales bacterium]
MRKSKTVSIIALSICLALGAGVIDAAAQASQPYTWHNVRVAGGGFIPGIVFNTAERDLIYARTDIGGAYRMDKSTGHWIPLLDWIGWDDWGLTGVVSLATDPVDPRRVYAACGTYTNSWDPENGAILRSSDYGENWEISELPFKLGGNMPGRGCGERLAVDPNDNRILYLGAPSGNGLWKSTDYGVSWSKVSGFPNPGNYVDDPSNDYTADKQGIYWVTFDKDTASSGGATQTIYVGVADKSSTCVYRTTNGGSAWQAVPGQPTGLLPHKGKLDTINDFLYIAYSDNGGPYDGQMGDVWRYGTASGEWTCISPVENDGVTGEGDNYFGYSGLSIDAQHPSTVMITAYSSWWPDTIIWRSTDHGNTWSKIWDWVSYPSRSFRYSQDVSDAPWLEWGGRPGEAEVLPKLGWMTESLEIDPFDSNRMMYGTGATIYGTNNLTSWDNGGTVNISVMCEGLEETSVLCLLSPPSGPPLLSGLGDIYGFCHERLDEVPEAFFSEPRIATSSMDYAELKPGFVYRVGKGGEEINYIVQKSSGMSNDGGRTWTMNYNEPAGITDGGTVAVGADGTYVVWSPAGSQVHYSNSGGSAWMSSSGLPAEAIVASDRVNPKKFYGFSEGRFYVSTDGGATFTSTVSGLPGEASVKAIPGREGDVWLAGGEDGLYHSTDSGATFSPLANVEEADTIGFGKAASGEDYMAVYTSARIGGIRGIFRSDDRGNSWIRINDDRHQWAWTGKTITGDPRVYGRVYIGTNGRGIICGEPSGGTVTSPPTTPPQDTPTPTPTATPGVTLGDANGDNSINIVDALLTAQYYVGLEPAGFITDAADVDCNGTINIVDALMIARYYVGLVSEFC